MSKYDMEVYSESAQKWLPARVESSGEDHVYVYYEIITIQGTVKARKNCQAIQVH